MKKLVWISFSIYLVRLITSCGLIGNEFPKLEITIEDSRYSFKVIGEKKSYLLDSILVCDETGISVFERHFGDTIRLRKNKQNNQEQFFRIYVIDSNTLKRYIFSTQIKQVPILLRSDSRYK
jgi:hypothetical protein